MNSKPFTVVSAGAEFLHGHPNRRRILGDFEIALAVSRREGCELPPVAAAARTIERHRIAEETGLDYYRAAEDFMCALTAQQWALELVLTDKARAILSCLRAGTESAETPGAQVEPGELLEAVLAAYLAAVEPDNPLAADCDSGGAGDAGGSDAPDASGTASGATPFLSRTK